MPPPPPTGNASLAGTVYIDIDGNGVQDPGEGGWEGVTLHLTGTDDLGQSVNLTAVSDGDGRFTFTGLRAGTYTLSEEQPEGLVSTLNTAGNAGGTVLDDVISNIVVGSGFQADGYFFGVITNGFGMMPSYAYPIPPADRWAIIAHVRELQRKRSEAPQP